MESVREMRGGKVDDAEREKRGCKVEESERRKGLQGGWCGGRERWRCRVAEEDVKP